MALLVFLAIFCGLYVPLSVFVSWLGKCNDRTYDERGRLIDAFCEDETMSPAERTAMYDAYESVSYHAHIWRRLTFRSPAPLYKAAGYDFSQILD